MVKEIPVTLPHPALPESDWADAWQVVVDPPFVRAREAAEAIVGSFPAWTYPALAVRQIIVTPFGLKGADSVSKQADVVGIFPVTDETTSRLVAGFDDTHLDFRIIVDLDPTETGQAVTLTTAIRRHNTIGRTYLQMVLPFHRTIIRSGLGKAARRRA
ncbi:MAG: DUF2867 domain-containing protein [Pseudomonadota bacterium]